MTEEHQHTHNSGCLPPGFVMVAMPARMVPALREEMNRAGVELEVADDGEDEATVPTFVAVPSSDVLSSHLARLRLGWRLDFCFFLIGATLWVWSQVLTWPLVIQLVCGFWMFISAFNTVRGHRRWEKLRQLQAQIRGLGH